MFKVSRLTDYGVVLLRYLASESSAEPLSARDLALKSGLPLPTVSKLLKIMAKHELITAQRGAQGGYELAQDPKNISLFKLLEIFEGKRGLTTCLSFEKHTSCQIDLSCPQRSGWSLVHHKLALFLKQISLDELISPLPSKALESLGAKHV